MAETLTVKNLRDCVLTIYDGDSPVNEVNVAFSEGNLQYAETEQIEQHLDRGDLSHMREGDEVPVTGSFSARLTELLSQGDNRVTIREALKRVGAAAAWVSTNDDNGDVDTIGLKFRINTPVSAELDELVDFGKCHVDSIQLQEGAPANTISVNFTDFETAPTISKIAAGS